MIYFPPNNTIRSLQGIHSVVHNELCVIDITALVLATCKSRVAGLGLDCWCSGVWAKLSVLFLSKKPLHIPLQNFMSFLSTHGLLMTSWMAAWPSGISAAPPSFVLFATHWGSSVIQIINEDDKQDWAQYCSLRHSKSHWSPSSGPGHSASFQPLGSSSPYTTSCSIRSSHATI